MCKVHKDSREFSDMSNCDLENLREHESNFHKNINDIAVTEKLSAPFLGGLLDHNTTVLQFLEQHEYC